LLVRTVSYRMEREREKERSGLFDGEMKKERAAGGVGEGAGA